MRTSPSSETPRSGRSLDLTDPPWIYLGGPFTHDDAVGYEAFVYRITRLSTGRMYLGKKVFWARTTKPPLKGQRCRRRVVSPSDWPTYWGSNHELLREIEEMGTSDFRREILHLCHTRGESSYLEAKEQFLQEVLERPDLFYNELIRVRVHRNHLPKKN